MDPTDRRFFNQAQLPGVSDPQSQCMSVLLPEAVVAPVSAPASVAQEVQNGLAEEVDPPRKNQIGVIRPYDT
jgi:hypothetical protein